MPTVEDIDFAKAVLASRQRERKWSQATRARVLRQTSFADHPVPRAETGTASLDRDGPVELAPEPVVQTTQPIAVGGEDSSSPRLHSVANTLPPSPKLESAAAATPAQLSPPIVPTTMDAHESSACGAACTWDDVESQPTTRPPTTVSTASSGALDLLKAKLRAAKHRPSTRAAALCGTPADASERGAYMDVGNRNAARNSETPPLPASRLAAPAEVSELPSARSTANVGARKPPLPFRRRQFDAAAALARFETQRLEAGLPQRAPSANGTGARRIAVARARSNSLNRCHPEVDRIVHKPPTPVPAPAVPHDMPSAVVHANAHSIENAKRVQFVDGTAPPSPRTVTSVTVRSRSAPAAAPPSPAKRVMMLRPKGRVLADSSGLGRAIPAGTGVTWEEERLLAAIEETNAALRRLPVHLGLHE
jgi:hypothetical protein